MKRDKGKVSFNYIPKDPLEVLKEFSLPETTREVIYTLGDQEIVKDNGKFYLCHTIYPNFAKEISKQAATEVWQDYGLKNRTDSSMSFYL